MEKVIYNRLFKWIFAISVIFSLCSCLASCDDHIEVYDTGEVGYILCTDGHVRTYDDMKATGTEPIAVVFYSSISEDDGSSNTYAVYLYDIDNMQFADSIGVSQSTSADITALDGKENTYNIMSTTDVSSSLADKVFDMWAYGQSAYVGSVQQMRLLYSNKSLVNKYLGLCGGDLLPDTADDCWYWTSTEVSGAENAQAWLVSMENGAIQETPKTTLAKIRPIVTVNR